MHLKPTRFSGWVVHEAKKDEKAEDSKPSDSEKKDESKDADK